MIAGYKYCLSHLAEFSPEVRVLMEFFYIKHETYYNDVQLLDFKNFLYLWKYF